MFNMFQNEIINKLKYYVYIYSNPETDEIFYVGKGKGNRVFAHLSDDKENEKVKNINEIRNKGLEPKIEILIHGLEDSETALRVESAVIDLIGTDKLTNKVRGWESGIYGRMSVQQLIQMYKKEKADITEAALLIKINKLFRYGMSPIELYDATRGRWVIGDDKDKVEYAFSVYDGIIQEVYKVIQWFKANSTFSTRTPSDKEERWEFIGNITSEDIRMKYVGKSVEHYYVKNEQNPIKY